MSGARAGDDVAMTAAVPMYVSVVEIAELASIPEAHFADGISGVIAYVVARSTGPKPIPSIVSLMKYTLTAH